MTAERSEGTPKGWRARAGAEVLEEHPRRFGGRGREEGPSKWLDSRALLQRKAPSGGRAAGGRGGRCSGRSNLLDHGRPLE
jgi:hypothetical protein